MKKIFIILLISLCWACQKDETTNPTTNDTVTKPTGNDLLRKDVVIGEANKFSFFDALISDGNDAFYFSGQLNNKSVVGKVDANGAIVWQRNLNFNTASLRLFIGEGVLKNALIIAGLTGTNSNPTGRGVVALYDANGTLLSDISFAEYNLTFFNDVNVEATGFTDNSIKYTGIAIGGAGNNTGDIVPYYATFAISSQGILSKKFPVTQRLSQYPQTRFGKFPTSYNPDGNYGGVGAGETDGGTGGGGASMDLKITMPQYVSYYQRNSAGENIDVGVIRVNFIFEFSSSNNSSFNNFTQINWRKQVNAQSSLYSNYIDDLVILGNNIYTVGRAATEDNKAVKPNNGYWAAGQICSLDTTGNIVWNRTISVSKHSDRLFQMVLNLEDGGFYVCGESNMFTLNGNKEYFGYAWLAKIDPNSGNILGSKTFGQENSQAKFNGLCIQNNKIFAVGYKGYQSDDKESKAWFAEIERNGL